MNNFQHKKDNVAFKLLECQYEKKYNNEFIHKWKGTLKSRQNEAMKDLQLCWKPLKSNFLKIFLVGGKILNYF